MVKKVKFIIDQDLDYKNHLIGVKITKNIINFSPKLASYFEDIRNAEKMNKKKVFEEKTKWFYRKEINEITELYVKQVQEMWNLIEEKYIKKMNNIFKNKFPYDIIYGVVSSTPFGYGYEFKEPKPWFACPNDKTITAVNVAMHEIMHAYFNKYLAKDLFEKYHLSEEQIFEFKESLTVLLNVECGDFRLYEDKGHFGHEKMRKKIKEEWNKSHDIDRVIKNIF